MNTQLVKSYTDRSVSVLSVVEAHAAAIAKAAAEVRVLADPVRKIHTWDKAVAEHLAPLVQHSSKLSSELACLWMASREPGDVVES